MLKRNIYKFYKPIDTEHIYTDRVFSPQVTVCRNIFCLSIRLPFIDIKKVVVCTTTN